MNLWSLDGVNAQVDLGSDERIEVVIGNFSYTPSGETHVPDGGACTKHCHCSSASECQAGTCFSAGSESSEQPSPSPSDLSSSPTVFQVQSSSPSSKPSLEQPEDSALCASNPTCAALGLAGHCCPTVDDVVLDCCSQPAVTPSQAPPAACSAHPACAHLAGNCCPTNTNVQLSCCTSTTTSTQATTAATTTAATTTQIARACSAHPACAHLADNCW